MALIPENELGVIVRFSQICSRGDKWSIESIQSRFPDAIVINSYRGLMYKTEFEYLASNFILHEHDPYGCDLIICWENDLGDIGFPIWELKSETIEAPASGYIDLGRKILSLMIENKKIRREYESEDLDESEPHIPIPTEEIYSIFDKVLHDKGVIAGVGNTARELMRRRNNTDDGWENLKSRVSGARKKWMHERGIEHDES